MNSTTENLFDVSDEKTTYASEEEKRTKCCYRKRFRKTSQKGAN